MGRTPWVAYLWPGLPELFRHGAWPALAVAWGFGVLVNLGVASSLVWDELLSPTVRSLVWLAVFVFWGSAAAFSYLSDGRVRSHRNAKAAGDNFGEAMDHYLQGNWFEAERILYRILRKNPRDVEAALMLATLLRHAGRLEESARRLDRVERLEDSRAWQLEICRERKLLEEARQSRPVAAEPRRAA